MYWYPGALGTSDFLLVLFLLMMYVCLVLRLSPVFLADPWGITVLTKDVKGSFDSIEYQGTASFDWKKNSLFFNNLLEPFNVN